MDPVEGALHNSLILSHIFSKLEIEEQKEFRNVNRLWRNSTLERWRRSSVVTLTQDDENRCFTKFIEFCNSEEIPRMADLPLRSFKIRSFNYGVVEKEEQFKTDDQVAFERFWDIFGPTMEYFELKYCTINSSFIHFIKWILLEKCPHLKELHISNCKFVRKEPSEMKSDADPPALATEMTEELELTKLCLHFNYYINDETFKVGEEEDDGEEIDVHAATSDFQSLLELLPNLKELHCYIWGSLNIFDGLTSPTFRTNSNSKLEILELWGCGEDALPILLSYVEAAQPPLKTLSCDVRTRVIIAGDPPTHLRQILGLCSATLIRLDLQLYYVTDDDDDDDEDNPPNRLNWITEFTGQNFPHLTHLTLNTHREQDVFDFKGLCGMPQLKKFVCTCEPCFNFNRYSTVATLKNLSVDELQYENDIMQWMEKEYESSHWSYNTWKNLNLTCPGLLAWRV